MRTRGAERGKVSPSGGLSCFCRLLALPAALLGSQLVASKAAAQEAEIAAQLAPSFAYVPGESGQVGCLPQTLIDIALQNVTERVLRDLSLDPDFVVMLTAGVLTCPSIFYLPVENDVSGIGYARKEESELFDRAPEHRLQGVAFLNDLPYWQDEPEEFESAFLHELGHRWLARVHASVDGKDVDLTGRDGDHWSYFLDSGGSPLEGNRWLDGENGDPPMTDTATFPKRYSPLDLYLMGAYAPEEVPPLRLLVPDENDLTGCDGAPLWSASPPQICSPLAAAGTFLPIEVGDVIAAEGPRVPSATEAQSTFSIAFVLLDPGGVGFDAERCEELDDWTARLIALFAEATEGRLVLENAVLAGGACDELVLAVPPPAASGCELVGRTPGKRSPSRLPAIALSGLLLAGLASRRLKRPG